MSQSEEMAACAERQIGKPYVWATAGPHTFDCSGLVYYCYKETTGKEISRSSYEQATLGKPVVGGAYQPGDILVYDNGSHVGIVTGPERSVHAFNPDLDVRATGIPGNTGLRFDGARRLFAEESVVDPPKGGSVTDHAVAGSTKKLRLPEGLDFDIQLTTVSPNRTYQKRQWTGTTQHTTNNTRVATGARMHARWQAQGTPGHPDGAVSVHFYVDDTILIQTLPIDETGIHSGDWRNTNHTALELCTNSDRNVNRAEANAIATQAALLFMLGGSAEEHLYPHTDGGHCPRLTMSWRDYEGRVTQALAALKKGVVTPPVPDVGGSYVGLPPWLPPAFFKASFPLADPAGKVTKEVIKWINTQEKVPWFIGKVDVGNGRNLWRFEEFTLISEKERVWWEGGTIPNLALPHLTQAHPAMAHQDTPHHTASEDDTSGG